MSALNTDANLVTSMFTLNPSEKGIATIRSSEEQLTWQTCLMEWGSYRPIVTGKQGWFPFQLQAQFGITHANGGKKNKEQGSKSDKCREWKRRLCAPWRVLWKAAWIRLQGDPWDMKVKGTKDKGGHIWQAGDTEDRAEPPHNSSLWFFFFFLVCFYQEICWFSFFAYS